MDGKRHAVDLSDATDRKCSKLNDSSSVNLTLNNTLFSEKATDRLHNSWSLRTNVEEADGSARLFQAPFCHCVLPNFLQETDAIEELQNELHDLKFSEKNNDLYKFHQSTEDLKTSPARHITAFRNLLTTTFRDWLINVTGIPLNMMVDMFCAKYNHTDTLLCHDDELEGRRIAYIYYLVRSWSHDDGGSLDLFDLDEHQQPRDIVKSIVPVRNQFVFFEVSPGSYHQVAEILSEDKTRLSITGWFHGPPITRPTPYTEAPRTLVPCGEIQDEVFFDWVNPVYTDIIAQASIQEKFEQDSEIELQEFLLPGKYDELEAALMSSDLKWTRLGPPNKRCYDKLATPQSSVIQTCIDLLQSDAVFLILSNMTGLRLHELAESGSESEAESPDADQGSDNQPADNKAEKKECTARCRSEVRRWRQGCYTLLHDTDTEGSEFALDIVLYVGCEDWEEEYGGQTSYITKGEDEELLTVTPEKNSLALVYRDKESLRFVKHLNSDVKDMDNKGFYDISAVYYE